MAALLRRMDEIAALARAADTADRPAELRQLARRFEGDARAAAGRLRQLAAEKRIPLDAGNSPADGRGDVDLVALRRAEGQMFMSSFLSGMSSRLEEAAAHAAAGRARAEDPAVGALLLGIEFELARARDAALAALAPHAESTTSTSPPPPLAPKANGGARRWR